MKCKYEGSGAWEGRCVGTKEVDPCVGIKKCDRYKPNYMTNADRIRAMSVEELATDLLDMFEEIFEDGVPSKEWMMMWLKQPVKDGDNDG